MIRLVYIAGKFSATNREGVERNIASAVDVALEVARAGAFPVCPHANTAHPDFEQIQPYEFWIDGTIELMKLCHAVMMVPGWQSSNGAKAEREIALSAGMGMPVFETIEELWTWLGSSAT